VETGGVSRTEVEHQKMSGKRHWYPFNAEQSLNIASEIGPLVAMFVVNFAYGVEAGVWSLVATTVVALVASIVVLKRPPIMPFIAGAVTVTFGALTLLTGDPKWVQIKVTIFNSLVAVVFFIGLMQRKYFFEFVFGKTFHYKEEGWRLLTRNAAIFFLVTALANEAVRLGFATASIPCPEALTWLMRKEVLDGLDIWMIFKLFIVMPFTTLYFVWQVRAMQGYRLPEKVVEARAPVQRN
jgi:intracellular septation protein